MKDSKLIKKKTLNQDKSLKNSYKLLLNKAINMSQKEINKIGIISLNKNK